MSARASFKGYLFQTLICLLDALNDSDNWKSFTIEPDEEATKVDILWESSKSTTLAVQVKSSVKPFSKPDVERWAKQLESDFNADNYELILIGNPSRSVAQEHSFGKVHVPLPRQSNILEMIQQAAHKLDVYLEKRNFSKIPPLIRELLIDGLVSRLAAFSTEGTKIEQSEFDNILRDWILNLYPQSINEIRDTYCEVLGNTVNFWPQDNKLSLSMPLEFVNSGKQVAIIEYLVLQLICGEEISEFRYVASIPVDVNILQRGNTNQSLEQVREIAILPNNSFRTHILFAAVEEPIKFYKNDREYGFTTSLFVKYRGRSAWMMQKYIEHSPPKDFYKSLRNGLAQFNTVHPDTTCITSA